MNLLLDISAIIAIIFWLFKIAANAQEGLLIAILIKPLIDTAWDVSLLGFSVIEIFSMIFVVAAFQILSIWKKIGNYKVLLTLWFLAHGGLIFTIITHPLQAVNGIIKSLFFPVAIVFLKSFLDVKDKDLARRTLRYLLIGASFSSIVSISQYIGLLDIESTRITKGLVRSSGFYHDIVTGRIYMIQGLLTLSYIYFSPHFNIRRISGIALLSIFLVAGYTFYSKAAIVAVVFGAALFVFLKGRFSLLLIVVLTFVYFIKPNADVIIGETQQVFSKEISYQMGELENGDQLFSGRGQIWSHYLEIFSEQSWLKRFFGLGINSGRVHSEFLRILLLSGYIGLVAMFVLVVRLILIGVDSYSKKSPVRFILLYTSVLLVIDGSGVVWGLYPTYLLIVIGFFSAGLEMADTNDRVNPILRIC